MTTDLDEATATVMIYTIPEEGLREGAVGEWREWEVSLRDDLETVRHSKGMLWLERDPQGRPCALRDAKTSKPSKWAFLTESDAIMAWLEHEKEALYLWARRLQGSESMVENWKRAAVYHRSRVEEHRKAIVDLERRIEARTRPPAPDARDRDPLG